MIETIEFSLLLDAIHQKYGVDFHNYAEASLKRRIKRHMGLHQISTLSSLQEKILHDSSHMDRLFQDIFVHVTEMFRDPLFYIALREHVLPILETYPFFRIWHAGCATGEEVYSLAILLKEVNLLERARIYATDISDSALVIAKQGIYAADHIKTYTENYHLAEGEHEFSDYYIARYGRAIMGSDLRKHITFANHNLVSDGVFNEFQLILCRNVLIYFDKYLKAQCIDLFRESLSPLGMLALGNKEHLSTSDLDFKSIADDMRIYRNSA
ncbi:MAG: protein-glutamate O-methyltransferase CheR [Mariprofundaceae bacterium]